MSTDGTPTSADPTTAGPSPADPSPAAPSTTGTTFAITNAHVHPVEGDPFTGSVVVTDGAITAAGPGVAIPAGAEVVDAAGGWVTPGLVDAHVHLGLHGEGNGPIDNDTNEMTDPNMAAARAIDAINPMDIGFDDALEGGVTSVNVNPGSGNPIGGQTVAIKTWGRIVDDMVMRDPSGVKSALGENPKRTYGERKQTPSTRLGTALVIRQAFEHARAAFADDSSASSPASPTAADTALQRVLTGEIPWRQHSHRADDLATALRLADEFGYRLVLDHGTEAWKIPDVIADRGVPVLYGPLIITRTKVENRDRNPAGPAILHEAGVEVSIITDHPVVPIKFAIDQAALAVKHGLDHDAALRAVTINPARVMGVDDRIGSIVPGKDADLVLWESDPLDTRNRALRVWIQGREVLHYDEGTRTPWVRPRY